MQHQNGTILKRQYGQINGTVNVIKANIKETLNVITKANRPVQNKLTNLIT